MRLTDKQIIEKIKKEGQEKEEAVSYLYFNNKDLLSKNGLARGIRDDEKREGAYNDAILGCVKGIENDKFRQDSTIRTFLNGILNFKCQEIYRRLKGDKLILGELDPEIQGIVRASINFERVDLLKNIFKNCHKYKAKKMCDKCKKILFDWANGYSMKEIAKRNNIKNADATKVGKARCLKMIREMENKKL